MPREHEESRLPKRSSFVYTDKTLTCADCGQEFTFTASEQEFYAQRAFSEPRQPALSAADGRAQAGSTTPELPWRRV